jgi:hypothetical protein
MWTDPGNINHSRIINVEVETEAAQFLFWEYINGISVAVCLRSMSITPFLFKKKG